MLSVIIITMLRLLALRNVDSTDFTYSKGYLGFLSALGVLLGMIGCLVPVSVPALGKILPQIHLILEK